MRKIGITYEMAGKIIHLRKLLKQSRKVRAEYRLVSKAYRKFQRQVYADLITAGFTYRTVRRLTSRRCELYIINNEQA